MSSHLELKKMPEIHNLTQIKTVLENIDALSAVEEGFVAYSNGRVVVPPVGDQ
jgi:ornithine cyclodeaminase